MDALKLEAYFFSNNIKYPDQKDIPGLIEKFQDYELMPQYFQEQGSRELSKAKRLCFTNPITNFTVFFHTDRIVFVQNLNPFEEGFNLDSALAKFYEFLKYAISACHDFSEGGLKGTRLSFVGNFIVNVNVDTSDSAVARAISGSMPWVEDQLTEVKLRTGETKSLPQSGENINVIVSVNDGVVEKKQGPITEQKVCFLTHVDVNTKAENTDPRFNSDSAIRIWDELVGEARRKLDFVSNFLV